MKYQDLQNQMFEELNKKELLKEAVNYSYEYIDKINDADVVPLENSLSQLKIFEENLPDEMCNPHEILSILQKYGAINTTKKSGGKYFGFVNGGYLPVSLASRWMSDTWDQNSGLFVMSPISSKLEEVCEKWISKIFSLPDDIGCGFVSGSSIATLCALTAARNNILKKMNHDIYEHGLTNAPNFNVIVGQDAHSSVWKALSILGIGKNQCNIAKTNADGEIDIETFPEVDENTLIIIQAGNVSGGAFDPIEKICSKAEKVGAWVHIDGAFGLWAAASNNKKYLVKGMEKASSWSVDAHKTLNVPFDNGIVICKEKNFLIDAMQANGSYLEYSEHRDGMLYVPELSKRGRSVELWASLKFLGKSGIETLVDGLCENTIYFANNLELLGLKIENKVEFNQIVFTSDTDDKTTEILTSIQKSGEFFCSGATWNNKKAIRISLCSWQTTRKDIDECMLVIKDILRKY